MSNPLDINNTKEGEDIINDGLQTTCLKCDKSFNTLETYKLHLGTQSCNKTKLKQNIKKEKKTCDQCGKAFRYIRHFTKHMDGHAANNCRLCPQLMTNRKSLAIHLFEQHQIRMNPKSRVKCKYCEKDFVEKFNLHIHYKEAHKPNDLEQICLQCGIFFSDEAALDKHRNEQHVAWTCSRCPMTFSRRQQYLLHLETHNKHKCPRCRETFANLSTLSMHLNEVHGISSSSPRTCKICMKTFRRPSELQIHLRIHSGEKPWQCRPCSKDFHSFKLYTRHQRTVGHQAALVRLRVLPCDLCPNIYQDYSSLESHKALVHGKSAPGDLFQCEQCGYRAVTMFNLRRHQRTRHCSATSPKQHTICEQCGDRFATLAALKDHQLYRHSTTRDHVCTLCSKRFVRASCLNRHFKRHQKKQQGKEEAIPPLDPPIQPTSEQETQSQELYPDDPMAVFLDPISAKLLVENEFLPDLANDIESNLNPSESDLPQNIFYLL